MKKTVKRMVSLLLVFVFLVTAAPVKTQAAVPAAYQLPKLTGDMAQDVANIALSQVGYTYDGGTVYGQWWKGYLSSSYNYTEAAWCGMFACWCAHQAGAKMGLAFDDGSAKANTMWEFYKERGQAVTDFSSRPKAGDFIFYGDSSGYCSHVAVIIGYNEDTDKVITVGGNQGKVDGGMVTLREVPWYKGATWGSKYILGYGRPEYPECGTAVPTPIPTPTPTPEPGPDGYIDVEECDWYYSSVVYAKEHGIMSGLTEITFGPNQQLDRAQFATILYRLTGSPEIQFEKKFKDVSSGSWYAKAVIWASKAGIVSGYGNGSFGPNDPVTREQLATMMYRYANYLAVETVPKMTDISAYSDSGKVSSYAVNAMKWAVGYGLISGTTKMTINPLDNTTRAECASIIKRFMNAYLMD